MLKKFALTASLIATLSIGAASAQTLVAYWDQNSNALPLGTNFGFLADPSAFPQLADQGSGQITFGGGILSETNVDGDGNEIYTWIPSFAGSTVNAQPSIASGGSLSIQGGTANANNGAFFQFEFSMTGLNSLDVSYATRGTSSGFTSQTWSWSLNGVDFTDFETFNSITTTFGLVELNTLSALDNAPSAFLRVTFDGATGTTGNNRLDNITLTAVPEPGTIALLALGAVVVLYGIRRRRAIQG